MQRTQISLADEQRRALDAAAARTGRSLSALIREAVDVVYGSERSLERDRAAMRRGFGAWAQRDTDGEEWVDGEQWVVRLRSGSRLPGPG